MRITNSTLTPIGDLRKVKAVLLHVKPAQRRGTGVALPVFILGCVVSATDRFTPRKVAQYPSYRGLGGSRGAVWIGPENFTPTGFRTPDRRCVYRRKISNFTTQCT